MTHQQTTPIPEAGTAAADQVTASVATEHVVGRSGIDLIAAERRRQTKKEGWTNDHDDKHTDHSLAMAAALYASPNDNLEVVKRCGCCKKAEFFEDAWPWWNYNDSGRGPRRHRAWDKRDKHPRLRRLVIAGALIAAEIDRLQRAECVAPIGSSRPPRTETSTHD